MRRRKRWPLLTLAVATLVAFGLPAQAEHATNDSSNTMHALGHSPHPAQFLPVPDINRQVNSDIAFWGNLAIHGNYDGFRIVDISDPGDPRLISHPRCNGNQGDVIVWENIVVRSWNSPASEGRFCDGEPVPLEFEGVHIWDIGDPTDPEVVASVETPNGSHTATGVPDLENNRLLVYNNSAPGGFDMIEVPLDDPAGANYLGAFATGRSCHDWGVILGDAMRAACSGGGGFSMFSLDPADGASLDNPVLLYSMDLPGLGGHSAAFSWDGEVYIHGWEPGGGSNPRCTETGTQITPTVVQTDDMKSVFFFNTETGELLGKWIMPRPQTLEENCTIHNYNVVPLRSGRRVLVSGNYQSGTSVVDFTDPANAVEIGFSDPAPLVPRDVGGAWSSYWYNSFIYESDITRGLNVHRFSGKEIAGALRLAHLNPQTQEFTLP
jgi:hypothetical protein